MVVIVRIASVIPSASAYRSDMFHQLTLDSGPFQSGPWLLPLESACVGTVPRWLVSLGSYFIFFNSCLYRRPIYSIAGNVVRVCKYTHRATHTGPHTTHTHTHTYTPQWPYTCCLEGRDVSLHVPPRPAPRSSCPHTHHVHPNTLFVLPALVLLLPPREHPHHIPLIIPRSYTPRP